MAAVGLATQEERLEEVLPSCIPVLSPFQALEERSLAARFALVAPGHLPLWRLAWEVCSQPQQRRLERGCPYCRQL